jgi:hypothetical protein
MLKPKHHIAAFLFLVILSLPIITFIYLQIQQKIVQHEMIERLEHSELDQVTIHNDYVKWFKRGKEIILNAQLFDVHSHYTKGDSTVFNGLFDIKETALKIQVKKLMERKTESDSSRDITLAKLVLQLWVNDDRLNERFLIPIQLVQSIKFIKEEQVLSRSISIPFPPPKV